jgi:hypothetical protein
MPIGGTGVHEGERGRLAAVVGHQVQRLALDPVRELAVYGAVERDQPMPGPRLQAGGQVDLPIRWAGSAAAPWGRSCAWPAALGLLHRQIVSPSWCRRRAFG